MLPHGASSHQENTPRWKILKTNFRKNNSKHILLIKPSSLGDIIHGLPVLYAIRKKWPGSKISWLVKEVYADILSGNPYIDELILLQKNSLTTSILSFRKRLIKGSFDLAVDLQGLFRSGLISYLSGAPLRIGFSNARELAPMFYTHKVQAPINLHAVNRNLKIAASLGCDIHKVKFPVEVNGENLHTITEFLKENRLADKSPLIVFAPGGRWDKKRWPAEFFSRLGSLLYQEMKAGIILIGNQLERKLIDEIQGGIKNPSVKAIDFSLSNLTALLSKVDIIVTNDSGPMHIASATGTPVVALFGPTDPDRTGPYATKNLIIRKDMECIPCFRKPCVHNSFVCMESITVEEVLEGVKRILK